MYTRGYKKIPGGKKNRANKGTAILITILVITALYFLIWNAVHMKDTDYMDKIYGVDTGADMDGYCYYYSQLTSSQKYVYQSLYRSCEKFQSEVFVNDTSESDIKRAWNAFRCVAVILRPFCIYAIKPGFRVDMWKEKS